MRQFCRVEFHGCQNISILRVCFEKLGMRKGAAKQRGERTQQKVGQSHHGHHSHHTALTLAKVEPSTAHLKGLWRCMSLDQRLTT